MLKFSGSIQISSVRNGAFYNVDTGVEPHVRLNYPESFYDREGLVEMIHNLMYSIVTQKKLVKELNLICIMKEKKYMEYLK